MSWHLYTNCWICICNLLVIWKRHCVCVWFFETHLTPKSHCCLIHKNYTNNQVLAACVAIVAADGRLKKGHIHIHPANHGQLSAILEFRASQCLFQLEKWIYRHFSWRKQWPRSPAVTNLKQQHLLTCNLTIKGDEMGWASDISVPAAKYIVNKVDILQGLPESSYWYHFTHKSNKMQIY